MIRIYKKKINVGHFASKCSLQKQVLLSGKHNSSIMAKSNMLWAKMIENVLTAEK